MVGVAQRGTASCCIALEGGIPVAAKTGTAQLNAAGEPERSHVWIIAFAPADDPKYAVAVMLKGTNEEISAGTGGRLAGPIAKAMLDEVFAPTPRGRRRSRRPPPQLPSRSTAPPRPSPPTTGDAADEPRRRDSTGSSITSATSCAHPPPARQAEPVTNSGEATFINDRYEIHKRIGRGGMADVFLARDLLLDRQVAIKVLFPEFAIDPNFVERFRREAQAAANLSHPNIVNVYDWGKYSGTYFIAMEYVQGRTLAEILAHQRRR